jgi:hypothetical protein
MMTLLRFFLHTSRNRLHVSVTCYTLQNSVRYILTAFSAVQEQNHTIQKALKKEFLGKIHDVYFF